MWSYQPSSTKSVQQQVKCIHVILYRHKHTSGCVIMLCTCGSQHPLAFVHVYMYHRFARVWREYIRINHHAPRVWFATSPCVFCASDTSLTDAAIVTILFDVFFPLRRAFNSSLRGVNSCPLETRGQGRFQVRHPLNVCGPLRAGTIPSPSPAQCMRSSVRWSRWRSVWPTACPACAVVTCPRVVLLPPPGAIPAIGSNQTRTKY